GRHPLRRRGRGDDAQVSGASGTVNIPNEASISIAVKIGTLQPSSLVDRRLTGKPYIHDSSY
ncbi:MAG: hypothetical protein KDC54_12860, partial [Lewinella sp.]|nr:hypothetical protein [Lewinella sp.]